MRYTNALLAGIVASLSIGASSLHAGIVNLFDYAYNIDGVVTAAPSPAPPGVNGAGFDYLTGLGTITYSFNTPGSHFAGLFVDHEIDEVINTFFNEFGLAVGAPAAGQSWEIDEPGFVFGNIYNHFAGSTAGASLLDNTNSVPSGSPNDVSMAMGWNFALAADETAEVTFRVDTVAPTSGFSLQHTDPQSNMSVYFSSSNVKTVIPEPATAAWGVACLIVATAARRRPSRTLA